MRKLACLVALVLVGCGCISGQTVIIPVDCATWEQTHTDQKDVGMPVKSKCLAILNYEGRITNPDGSDRPRQQRCSTDSGSLGWSCESQEYAAYWPQAEPIQTVKTHRGMLRRLLWWLW